MPSQLTLNVSVLLSLLGVECTPVMLVLVAARFQCLVAPKHDSFIDLCHSGTIYFSETKETTFGKHTIECLPERYANEAHPSSTMTEDLRTFLLHIWSASGFEARNQNSF